MILRQLIVFLACVCAIAVSARTPAGIPGRSWVIEGMDEQSVRQAVTESPGDALEGIWSATADGARIAVVPGVPDGMPRSFADGFLLVILRSPRIGIPAGTVMGWCAPAARSGYYDSYIFTGCDGRSLSAPKRFTLRLNDSSHLSMIMVHDGIEIVAWRLIPYMFRSMLRERHDRPRDLDGMLRLWPSDPDNPLRPRYL